MTKTPPTKEEREQVRILLNEAEDNDALTEWEAGEFLPSLKMQSSWSETQREVLDQIWRKVME